MDALGVLRAARAGLSVPPAVLTHLRALTESGALYPFVFDALLGVDEAPAQAPHHALAYIRAVMPWQVQNQVWASAVLAGSLPE